MAFRMLQAISIARYFCTRHRADGFIARTDVIRRTGRRQAGLAAARFISARDTALSEIAFAHDIGRFLLGSITATSADRREMRTAYIAVEGTFNMLLMLRRTGMILFRGQVILLSYLRFTLIIDVRYAFCLNFARLRCFLDFCCTPSK